MNAFIDGELSTKLSIVLIFYHMDMWTSMEKI